MSLLRTLAVLATSTLAVVSATPLVTRTPGDNSTCSVALSSDGQCSVFGPSPGTLKVNECYNVSTGIGSLEFYEEPTAYYKQVVVYASDDCTDVAAYFGPERVGCSHVDFEGYSVKYVFSG